MRVNMHVRVLRVRVRVGVRVREGRVRGQQRALRGRAGRGRVAEPQRRRLS